MASFFMASLAMPSFAMWSFFIASLDMPSLAMASFFMPSLAMASFDIASLAISSAAKAVEAAPKARQVASRVAVSLFISVLLSEWISSSSKNGAVRKELGLSLSSATRSSRATAQLPPNQL